MHTQQMKPYLCNTIVAVVAIILKRGWRDEAQPARDAFLASVEGLLHQPETQLVAIKAFPTLPGAHQSFTCAGQCCRCWRRWCRSLLLRPLHRWAYPGTSTNKWDPPPLASLVAVDHADVCSAEWILSCSIYDASTCTR